LVLPVGAFLLTIPGTKRELYLLPLIAPLGIAVGAWVAATVGQAPYRTIDRFTNNILFVLLSLVFVCGFAAMVWAYSVSPAFFLRFHTVLHTEPPAPLSFILLGALLAAGGGLILCGVDLWKRRSPSIGAHCSWMALAFVVLGGPLAYRLGDGFKSLHYMTRELQALGASSSNLVGYCLDETTRSIIPYDTGFMPQNITGHKELSNYIRKNPSARLLTFEEYLLGLPEDIHSRLRVVGVWRFSKHRTYGLYEFSTTTPDAKE
jgi:hypothetical protein